MGQDLRNHCYLFPYFSEYSWLFNLFQNTHDYPTFFRILMIIQPFTEYSWLSNLFQNTHDYPTFFRILMIIQPFFRILMIIQPFLEYSWSSNLFRILMIIQPFSEYSWISNLFQNTHDYSTFGIRNTKTELSVFVFIIIKSILI